MEKPEVKYELHKPATYWHFESEEVGGKIGRVHPEGHNPEMGEDGDRTFMLVTVVCPFCEESVRSNTWDFHVGKIYCKKCGARHWQYRSTVPVPVKPLNKKTKLFQALNGI